VTVTRTNVGRSSRVFVDMDDEKARRVFIRFADADAKKRANKVEAAAKIEAPTGKTGDLRRGIRTTQSRDVQGRYSTGYDVTSNAAYSLYVIKGTRPHKITGNPLLAFFWPKLGANVVFRSVNHPGTKGNNFLGRALRRAR
jgi:hypothetical protein